MKENVCNKPATEIHLNTLGKQTVLPSHDSRDAV